MEKFLDLLAPKTFGKLHYVAVFFWVLLGGILLVIFRDMENKESELDIHCDKSENNELVRGRCFDEYEKQHNKYGFPMYGFVIINFVVIVFVCVAYSQIVTPTVDQLSRSRRNSDPERQPLDQEVVPSTGYKLFIAYCGQLSTKIILGVLFIILQTQLLYPLKFPSNFNCYLTDETNQPRNSSDTARNSTLHECLNRRAAKKTFWMDALLVVNGIFAAGILIETVYILSKAWLDRSFMQDSQFLKTYLNSSQTKSRQEFIKRMKERITTEAQELRELQPLFLGNPGEKTAVRHLTVDQIYTNLVLIEDRDEYNFAENREEQLKVYPRSRKETSHQKTLEDVLNAESKKVLIVGRPGIGKTFYCTKLLVDWASGALKDFDAAFLVKFRKFNSFEDLSLRELLIKSEYFPTTRPDDEDCSHLVKNPEGVLIIFDGFDEFKPDENIEPIFAEGIDEKRPLLTLYQGLVKGKLLKHASVLTTTRPTALPSIRDLPFDKTLEILGFSLEQIEEYVYKFAGDDKQTGEILWLHISSNMNLLSLCYVPVNSFIMCSSLLQILHFDSSAGVTLPSKLTAIYKIAVKVFYYSRTDKLSRDKPLTREVIESDDLTDEVQEKFEKLGKVAFDGINEGKLILGGNEVGEIEDSALFHQLPDRQTSQFKHEKQFCFIHLTMQEFFAARHLVNNMNETKLRNFVSENIENGKWQLVFQFLAGLMNDKESLPGEIFTDLLPVKTEKDEDEYYNEEWTENGEKTKVTYWPTLDEQKIAVTLLKCLNESSKMTTVVQRKLQQRNFNCVYFNGCYLTAVDCSSLVSVIKNVRGISHLDLSGNNMEPSASLAICILLKCSESQLSWLNLAANQLKDEGAQHLADAITNSNCKLRTLDLRYNNITDTGAQHLADAITNSNCQLRTLDLSSTYITDTGAQHLADAITNSNCKLRTLDLSYNNITVAGAQHLADAITNSNCKLRTLDLSSTYITDTGAQHLADAITNSNCKLRTLDLSYNNITDTGAQHLADAITNSNCQLLTLSLFNNHITDTGKQYALNLVSNSQSKCKLVI